MTACDATTIWLLTEPVPRVTDSQTVFKVYPELRVSPEQLEAFQSDRTDRPKPKPRGFFLSIVSVLIAGIGGFLGCGLAYLVCAVLNQILFVRLIFFAGITMPPTVLAISLSVAFTMGALSSIVPAINANRVPITEALRHLG